MEQIINCYNCIKSTIADAGVVFCDLTQQVITLNHVCPIRKYAFSNQLEFMMEK